MAWIANAESRSSSDTTVSPIGNRLGASAGPPLALTAEAARSQNCCWFQAPHVTAVGAPVLASRDSISPRNAANVFAPGQAPCR